MLSGAIDLKQLNISSKYINKGPDRATMLVQENLSRNEILGKEQINDVDEIKSWNKSMMWMKSRVT